MAARTGRGALIGRLAPEFRAETLTEILSGGALSGTYRLWGLDRQQSLCVGRVQFLGFSFGKRTERGSQAVHPIRMALADLVSAGVLVLSAVPP